MSVGFVSFGGGTLGLTTAAAGTAFVALVPGSTGFQTRVASFAYTAGNTAHNVTVLRPIGRTTVTTAAASGTADLVLAADPSPSGNTIAASDRVAVEHSDGTTRAYVVNTSGWNGTTKVLTLSTNLAANVAANARFWMFGVETDTDPATGTAHPKFATTTTATRTYQFVAGGIKGAATGDPFLFHSPNGTGAGTLDYVEFVNTRE